MIKGIIGEKNVLSFKKKELKGSIDTICLINARGNIKISKSDDEDIKINYIVNPSKDIEDCIFEFTENDNILYITNIYYNDIMSNKFDINISYDIKLNSKFNLTIYNNVGDIILNGINKKISVNNNIGNICIKNLYNIDNIDVKNNIGNITIGESKIENQFVIKKSNICILKNIMTNIGEVIIPGEK